MNICLDICALQSPFNNKDSIRTLLKAVQTKTLHEITNDAIHLLCQQMGVANTVRFLNQFIAGYGNYTVERNELFQEMSLDDILSEIRQQRTSRAL